jgi:hypothetical protein
MSRPILPSRRLKMMADHADPCGKKPLIVWTTIFATSVRFATLRLLAGGKRWLGIRSVAGRSVCCNFDDFGRILAAEMFGRLIGEAP